ncbi:MAG: hypothetical protein LUE64_01710 [Candidatus Gastranaerophilales bacterium]|nr:hypothetical protein [Candidatus Gastranaerophilales bacterium]
MFNYNLINPVNIHYRKYSQADSTKTSSAGEDQKPLTTDENGSNGQRFPNGNKVAIDYTKNQVNISQVLQDFRSTIAAINSPDDVKEEVESYLGLVGRESLKETPSREIVLSNLKNAALVTDKYIQESLKKPSRVVQDWVDALFLQKVNLKADPDEINEDFRVKIPSKNPSAKNSGGIAQLDEDTVDFSVQPQYSVSAQVVPDAEIQSEYSLEDSYIENTDITEEEIANAALIEEIDRPIQSFTPESGIFGAKTESEALAKQTLLEGIASFDEGENVYDTLKLYDRALELVEGSDNTNLKSAIYYERGKVFDSCDYVDLALIDYHKATKTDDNNLKAHAHIKMGNIYDDYVQIEPAVDQYSKAVSASEEADNPQGKTRALRYMASMFAGIYDKENTEIFSDMAMESAEETNNPATIAKTYLEAAENYKYIGEDTKALQVYSSLAQNDTVQDEYDTLAQNYMEASMLMDKKGNRQKSYALMLKSKEYQRLARLRRAEASE